MTIHEKIKVGREILIAVGFSMEVLLFVSDG